jgi:hypothetical protein
MYILTTDHLFYFRLELEVEPIFATMAVYDAKERKKV